MKVKATITITVEYKIDPLQYSLCGKDFVLAIEKKELCDREALINLLDNNDDCEITVIVKKVGE